MKPEPVWPNVESAEKLAERLEHLDKRITSPGENAILGAAAAKLREQSKVISKDSRLRVVAEVERDGYKRRLTAMFPLFEEARDALTAIPLTSAKLHNVRLDLADRMDDVGDPVRWAKREAERERVASFQANLDEEIDP